MLDYCLINILFYNQIESYEIIGEPKLHDVTKTIISSNNLYTKKDPDLTIIYQQPQQILDYYLQNTLTHKTKWLIITMKEHEDAKILFQFIRAFGDAILIQFPTPIIIIKNIAPNFWQNYRKDILKPIAEPDIQEFLNITITDISTEDCVQINGTQEELMTQSLNPHALYTYFGKKINEEQLKNLKELTKFSLKIIQCVNPNTNEIYGFFAQNDYMQQCWLLYLAQFESLKDTMNIRRIFLCAPI